MISNHNGIENNNHAITVSVSMMKFKMRCPLITAKQFIISAIPQINAPVIYHSAVVAINEINTHILINVASSDK